ncbi:MAG: hypothetical protein JOZ54_22450 [Acidobacteria bacterium]|nr:hypothetical protein [Acidobacteriota bacterium]
MHLLPVILRRAVITAAVCAVFWFSVTPVRQSVSGTLLTIGSFLLVGLIAGVFLTWPRPVWVRALIFVIFAALIGSRAVPMHPERPFAKLATGAVTVAPLIVLLAVVLGIDWVVAWAMRRRTTATAGSPPRSTS